MKIKKQNTKKNINFLPLLLLVILLIDSISCNKIKEQKTNGTNADNNSTSLLDIIDKYFNFSKKPVDGKFMFESNLCNNDPSLKNIALVGGVFYKKNGDVQMGTDPVTIGNYKLFPNGSGTYGFDKIVSQDGLFGTDVSFSITPPGNTVLNSPASANAATAAATVYSPLPISISNIPPKTPITLTPNAATQINWNVDSKDSNGVIILVEYIPSRYVNKTALAAGYIYVVESSILVKDNGSYSIPWSFFQNFPGGGHIVLWVARGNYSIASNGTYNYQVGGYTAAAVWDVFKPIPPTLINGTNSVFLSLSQHNLSGSITGYPGRLATVTIATPTTISPDTAIGSGGSPQYPTLNVSFGVNTSGGSAVSVVNTSKTVTFTMPASGSTSWSGNYSAPSGSTARGSVSVQ